MLPLAGMLDERALARFQNEAQAAAALHHPQIVPVYGLGCERGVHYYAMQLVDGESLDRIIKAMRAQQAAGQAGGNTEIGEVSPTTSTAAMLSTERSHDSQVYFRRVAALGQQVADALHHADEFGVVHRDIKPGNLLIDHRGRVWVADFGLARIEGNANLTMTGNMLGTLRYMSPEQLVGDRLRTWKAARP